MELLERDYRLSVSPQSYRNNKSVIRIYRFVCCKGYWKLSVLCNTLCSAGALCSARIWPTSFPLLHSCSGCSCKICEKLLQLCVYVHGSRSGIEPDRLSLLHLQHVHTFPTVSPIAHILRLQPCNNGKLAAACSWAYLRWMLECFSSWWFEWNLFATTSGSLYSFRLCLSASSLFLWS